MKGQRGQQIHQQVRKERRESKEQQHFVAPLTGKQARHVAGSEAATEYKPVIRGIAAEARGSRKRQGELKSDYAGLANEATANAQKATEGTAATNAAITQRLQEAGGQAQSSLNSLAAQDASTAKLLGGPTNAAGTAQMAAGNTARAQQLVALTAPNTAAGATYANYLRQRGTSAKERGIEATGNEALRRAKIKEDLRAAQKQKGQATVSNLNKLRGEERDYRIQQRAFPLEKQKAALEGREAAQGASLAAQKNQREREKQQNENTKTRNEGKNGGLSPSERHTRQKEKREAVSSKRGAVATARSIIQQSGIHPHTPKEWAGLEVLVRKESEVSPALAHYAVHQLRMKAEQREGRSGGTGAKQGGVHR